MKGMISADVFCTATGDAWHTDLVVVMHFMPCAGGIAAAVVAVIAAVGLLWGCRRRMLHKPVHDPVGMIAMAELQKHAADGSAKASAVGQDQAGSLQVRLCISPSLLGVKH